MVDRLNEEQKARLERLLEGLKASKVERGSRNKTVAEKTGYSEKSVANILSGNTAPTPKFIRAVCQAFDLDSSWIADGKGLMFDMEKLRKRADDLGVTIYAKADPEEIKKRMGGFSVDSEELQRGGASKRSIASMMLIGAVNREHLKKISDLIAGIEEPEIREGVKELVKMPESRRWEAVGVLKRMNEEADKEKGGSSS